MAGTGQGGMSVHERRRRAASGARVLARHPSQLPMGRRLRALLDEAEGVVDLDEVGGVYGQGLVEVLEARVAELLGAEQAVVFPTGTMAQQVAVRCWTAQLGCDRVALHGLAHPLVHEQDAWRRVGAVVPVTLTDEARPVTGDDVRALREEVAAVALELPLRDAGYLLPTWEELHDVVDAARERDAAVHVDGARLWECTAHFARPLAEIAGLADSVYVSFYKTLGGLAGAAVAGPAELAAPLRLWRHRYGGLVFEQFPVALSALVGLHRELPRLPDYVAHARTVAVAMVAAFAEAGVVGAQVVPGAPHTHQFQLWVPGDPGRLSAAAVLQGERDGVMPFTSPWQGGARPPGAAMTEVTVAADGLGWTPQDVREAVLGFVARW